MSWPRLIAAAAVMFVSACGFQPIHGGAKGPEVRAELAAVQIAPIEERVGQILRNNLLDSMNPAGAPARPEYRLMVQLTESKQELGIRRTEFATRANLLFTASFRLIRLSDRSQVFSGTSNLAASYNILSNEFATLAAESDARTRAMRELSDDITQRVAAYFRQHAQGKS